MPNTVRMRQPNSKECIDIGEATFFPACIRAPWDVHRISESSSFCLRTTVIHRRISIPRHPVNLVQQKSSKLIVILRLHPCFQRSIWMELLRGRSAGLRHGSPVRVFEAPSMRNLPTSCPQYRWPSPQTEWNKDDPWIDLVKILSDSDFDFLRRHHGVSFSKETMMSLYATASHVAP